MTQERLAYANKLKNNIEKAKAALIAPIPLDVVIKRAKESASVIGYLSPEQVDRIREEVKQAVEKEIAKMQEEFDKL